jgi:predicted secreted protein
MRFLPAAFLALLVSGDPAFAADNGERGFALFSPDGRYFAYELYGIQDGSGFPFSDVFVIDLTTNSLIEGTPLRAQIEAENGGTISAARKESATKAGPILEKYKIAEPGELLAANTATEIVADRTRVSFGPFYPARGWVTADQKPAEMNRYTLTLAHLPFPAKQECDYGDPNSYGFALKIRDQETGNENEAYRDAAIPDTRYCPFSYDIGEVIGFRDITNGNHYVALVAMYTPGYEGLDRRLLAVPFTLPY